MSEVSGGDIGSVNTVVDKPADKPVETKQPEAATVDTLEDRVNDLKAGNPTEQGGNGAEDGEKSQQSKIDGEFESYPLLGSTLRNVSETLNTPALESLRSENPILAANWADDLKGDLVPACQRAIARGDQYAWAMQFADGAISAASVGDNLREIRQTYDGKYARQYLTSLGAKAQDSAGRGFTVDSGDVIKAILQDQDFPRVTEEQYKTGGITAEDFIVVRDDGTIRSVVVRTKLRDVQLILGGVFPDRSDLYLLCPSLRIKLGKPSEQEPDLGENKQAVPEEQLSYTPPNPTSQPAA